MLPAAKGWAIHGQGLPLTRTLLGQQSETQWPKMSPFLLPHQLLTTGTTPRHRLSPHSGPQGMRKVEGLEPQLSQRIVQMMEGKKTTLGNELKGTLRAEPLLKEREVSGRQSQGF